MLFCCIPPFLSRVYLCLLRFNKWDVLVINRFLLRGQLLQLLATHALGWWHRRKFKRLFKFSSARGVLFWNPFVSVLSFPVLDCRRAILLPLSNRRVMLRRGFAPAIIGPLLIFAFQPFSVVRVAFSQFIQDRQLIFVNRIQFSERPTATAYRNQQKKNNPSHR